MKRRTLRNCVSAVCTMIFLCAPAAAQATPVCFGDGSGTPCPCQNTGAPGNGCGSLTFGAGANLSATGSANIADDGDGTPAVTLFGVQMPNKMAWYYQDNGNPLSNGGLGIPFANGLRCIQTYVPLGTKLNVGNASMYPESSDPSITVRSSALGFPISPGETRHYQIFYRDDPYNPGLCPCTVCPPTVPNTTNALTIIWSP